MAQFWPLRTVTRCNDLRVDARSPVCRTLPSKFRTECRALFKFVTTHAAFIQNEDNLFTKRRQLGLRTPEESSCLPPLGLHVVAGWRGREGEHPSVARGAGACWKGLRRPAAPQESPLTHPPSVSSPPYSLRAGARPPPRLTRRRSHTRCRPAAPSRSQARRDVNFKHKFPITSMKHETTSLHKSCLQHSYRKSVMSASFRSIRVARAPPVPRPRGVVRIPQ